MTLFENEGEHFYAAENPNTLPEVLESLAKGVHGHDLKHFIIHKAVAANINSSSETLDYIAKMWNLYKENNFEYYSSARDILEKIAKNPNTSAETLKHICCWGMVDSMLLAQHPNVTGEILNSLVKKIRKYGDYNLFREVAENPKAWAETLDFLSKTRDKKTHEAVARNHNTSAKTLEFLSKHSYIEVLCTIASDARTPVNILKNLAVHKSKKVQNAVANNTNFVH